VTTPTTLDEVENALTLARLALMTARNPRETHDAYAQIERLKQERALVRAKAEAWLTT